MSDRKYRQRGYQDEPRERQQPKAPRPIEPRAPGRELQSASGPKTPNLMGMQEVFRCARCGNKMTLPVDSASACPRCGVAVHSCINCMSFDTSARWECAQQALTARVAAKDERNLCAFFEARTTVERQTGTAASASGTSSARQAFDDLFKN